MRILISCLSLMATLTWANASQAACTGSSPSLRAADASRTEVQACVTAALSGDTITVPPGSATWSTPIRLPAKDLTIKGSSVITCSNGSSSSNPVTCSATNNTNITCSTGVCFELPFTATHIISGFSMTVGGSGGDGGFNYVYGSSVNSAKYFRIHNNRIASNSGWAEMQLVAGSNCVHPQGVIDQNIMVDISVQPQGGDPGDSLGEGETGDCQTKLWAQQPPLGSRTGVVYIERNHIQNTSGNVNSTDSSHGGRYVFRFNNVTSGRHTSEIHGVQGSNRGSQLTEVYENAASGLSGYSGTVFWRGGTGVAFNNRQAASFSFGILLTNDRSEYDDSIAQFGNCDGSRTGVDQNASGQSGWRCRDQPGTGYDTSEWSYSPPGPYQQVAMPIYFWGNLTAGAQMSVSVDSTGNADLHIQPNRDFFNHSTATGSPQTVGVRVGTIANRPAGCTAGVAYWATDEGEWNSLQSGPDGMLYKCTATNTWTLYYTPLQYPHPWAVSTTGGLPSPTDLKVLQ